MKYCNQIKRCCKHLIVENCYFKCMKFDKKTEFVFYQKDIKQARSIRIEEYCFEQIWGMEILECKKCNHEWEGDYTIDYKCPVCQSRDIEQFKNINQ